MACYIVSFEVDQEATRTQVRERLKTFGGYCPINHTCWAITSDKKATEVRDLVAEVLQPGDRIIVIRSGTEAAWRNAFGPKNTEWLKKNL
jgi:hypothetical protein